MLFLIDVACIIYVVCISGACNKNNIPLGLLTYFWFWFWHSTFPDYIIYLVLHASIFLILVWNPVKQNIWPQCSWMWRKRCRCLCCTCEHLWTPVHVYLCQKQQKTEIEKCPCDSRWQLPVSFIKEGTVEERWVGGWWAEVWERVCCESQNRG